ncbi:hypothetical protein EJ08DRAFT_21267 [Tothia fuscella]|uniref:Uncharacterized protein n=1 Tax=Tothia fuscella TaxID=1048955 RepID=A0A9P4NZN6_9PEZI|nr:hypothetical protein EJ08DRAFT_21267 [Tothia fuscella]
MSVLKDMDMPDPPIPSTESPKTTDTPPVIGHTHELRDKINNKLVLTINGNAIDLSTLVTSTEGNIPTTSSLDKALQELNDKSLVEIQFEVELPPRICTLLRSSKKLTVRTTFASDLSFLKNKFDFTALDITLYRPADSDGTDSAKDMSPSENAAIPNTDFIQAINCIVLARMARASDKVQVRFVLEADRIREADNEDVGDAFDKLGKGLWKVLTGGYEWYLTEMVRGCAQQTEFLMEVSKVEDWGKVGS